MITISPFMTLAPEIWLLITACILLLVDLFLSKKMQNIAFYFALIALFGALFLILKLMGYGTETLFFESYIRDEIGNLLKFAICFFGIFVFLFSKLYVSEHKFIQGEYYSLCLFSILGMMVLVSAYSLLTLYLGVELLALPLYALIAMSKDKRSSEAAMKYFVMGALASGMLLYGISILYGATESFQIKEVAHKLLPENSGTPEMAVIIGMVLILVGLAFKMGAVPFHMWVPDIYEGSESSVTLFIATLPEIAGFGMAIRLLLDSFSSLDESWMQLWVVMSVLSLALGNIVAIAQSNLKRMLAYSSIGHMGFVFMGLLAGPDVGYAPALTYVIIYTIMALGAFGLLTVLSYQGFEAEQISDLRGLGKSQPFVAFIMLLVLFSLAGVPPTVGFYAKFLILNALVDAGYVWLAVLAVIFAVIGAFYYLRVVRMMFFDMAATDFKMPPCKKVGVYETTLLTLDGALILFLGIYPAPLIALCMSVF